MHTLGTFTIATKVALAAIFCIASSGALAHGQAGAGPQHEARKIIFPDTAAHTTLVVDLHTHSAFSDGHVWPKIRVEEALRDGLDAMAVTEHLEYQPHLEDIPHADRNRAYAITKDAAKNSQLMVIAGTEITRNFPAGHINAVFVTDANAMLEVTAPDDAADIRAYYDAATQWPAQNAVDAAAEQGAFVFWNHPFWDAQQLDGIAQMNPFHRANIKAGKLHGIEIANGRDYSAEAHAIALRHDLALIGVSDIHDLIDWDYPPYPPHKAQHRPVNLVLATERTPAALKEALFARRTLVWFKNLLIGRKPELDAMLAASLKVSKAAYRADTKVLDVTIENKSDGRFLLRNLTKMTFMDHADLIEIEPHGVTSFSIKPGSVKKQVELRFAVENALLAPGRAATIELTATP